MLSDQHSYARPTMAAANKRVLLYDRGGNSFRVDNSSGVVYEREMSNEILCAALNADEMCIRDRSRTAPISTTTAALPIWIP